MNKLDRKIILEHVAVAKTAACRMRSFYRSSGLQDEGYERFRKLDQAISEVESYFFNQPDDPADEHPLIWALRTALRDNPKVTDLQIASLVRQTLPEGWIPKIFEATLEGYDGAKPNSKDLVRWIAAPNFEAAKKYCQETGFGIPVIDLIETGLKYAPAMESLDVEVNREGRVI